MKIIKAFKLIYLAIIQLGNIIRLNIHQAKENRRKQRELMKELYLRNKTIELWDNKKTEGTNNKRFQLFTTIMNNYENETFNMINGCTDNDIIKMYNNTFYCKKDNDSIKSIRVYEKDDDNWPFTVSKLDIYCIDGRIVYSTIKRYNKEYHYALNGSAQNTLGLVSIFDSDFIKVDQDLTNENGGVNVYMPIIDYIDKGLELFN